MKKVTGHYKCRRCGKVFKDSSNYFGNKDASNQTIVLSFLPQIGHHCEDIEHGVADLIGVDIVEKL